MLDVPLANVSSGCEACWSMAMALGSRSSWHIGATRFVKPGYTSTRRTAADRWCRTTANANYAFRLQWLGWRAGLHHHHHHRRRRRSAIEKHARTRSSGDRALRHWKHCRPTHRCRYQPRQQSAVRTRLHSEVCEMHRACVAIESCSKSSEQGMSK
jgi:hypothetical protein